MIKVNFYRIDDEMVILIPLKRDCMFKFTSYIKLKRTSIRKILCGIRMNRQSIIHKDNYVFFMCDSIYLGSIDIPRKMFIDSLNVENGIGDSEYVKIMDTILSNLDSYV